MKHIKQLLVFLLIISVFNSCEKEEVVSYALDDISAPTNIAAQFDISSEEVGLVTITPSADGATMFEIYFGDVENETPMEVAPGETITHVYGEGEFNLRIVAVGLTGLTSELVRVVTISLEAPENLEVDVKISGTNPFGIEVTPSATNATVFDVYFGDAEDEEPTTIMAGETATHVYAEVGDYSVRVVARGAGVATLELTQSISITGASNAVKLPITFDDATVNYAVNGFGSADFGPIPAAVIDNPDISGINTTAKVLSVNKTDGAQVWAGVSIPLEGPIDFTNGTTVSVKVWSPRAGTPILFKIEDSNSPKDGNGNPTVFVEIQVNSTLANTWEEITFNLSSDGTFSTTKSYDTVILFPDFGTEGEGEMFYFDDIKLAAGNGGGVGEPEAATSLPMDFEDNKTFSGVFEAGQGVTGILVANPDKSGENTSETVFQFTKANGAAWYSGIFHIFPANMDLSSEKSFTFKIWSPKAGINVRMNLEKEGIQGGLSIDQTLTEANKWVTLTYNFSDLINAGDAYDKLVIFPDFNDVAQAPSDGSVYYIDDLEQTSGGGNGNGDGGNGTSGPTAAAPTPTAAAANVKSVFSNAYTNPAGVNYFPDWGQSTAYEMVSINGNNTIKYSNLNYQGIEIGENVDATAFESVRIDVWSGDYTSLPFFLISGSGERGVTLNLTPNQWNSINIPLSEFTSQGLSVNDVFQFKFDVQPNTGGTIYIDNLYFYTSGSNGGDNGGTTGVAPYSPIDFETGGHGANWTWSVFENVSNAPLEIVANPAASGINTSSTVAKFTALQAGQPWAGVESKRNEDIGDFKFDASNSIVKIMVYKSVISDVGLKFSEANGEAQPEVKVANTKINEWEELTFDMSGSIGKGITGIITQIIIFPDFHNRSSDNIVYFDNITFGSN